MAKADSKGNRIRIKIVHCRKVKDGSSLKKIGYQNLRLHRYFVQHMINKGELD